MKHAYCDQQILELSLETEFINSSKCILYFAGVYLFPTNIQCDDLISFSWTPSSPQTSLFTIPYSFNSTCFLSHPVNLFSEKSASLRCSLKVPHPTPKQEPHTAPFLPITAWGQEKMLSVMVNFRSQFN
uniref:Uncharacterized protein n=1 Tax=Rousettus aegyptiacus TaxID=9407 RepID=A0A7J8JH44_ROUAE|nr:hypothetical protein HJG63_010186 [Rousettus aegyptiacus]